MNDKKHFLNTDEGKNFLLERYVNGNESADQIAKELGTYSNRIYRALRKHKLPRKDRSEAQKNALAKGSSKHPTKGKKLDIKVKNQIGDKIHDYWKSLTPEKMEERVDKSRENWYNVPAETRKKWQDKSHKALRKSAQEGSRVEKYVLAALVSKGYKCEVHKKFLFENSECSVDIYMPLEGIAIEINGPSHSSPIWGQESFKKTVERDTIKVEQLLANGYTFVAIQNPKGYYSNSALNEFMQKFLPFIKNIANAPNNSFNEILIGDI